MYSISLLSAVILLIKQDDWSSCLHRSFEICFHSILWGSSASTPRTWHAKCRGRCQPFGANTKICYKVGNWHSSPSLRNIAAEPHFLKRRRLHAFTFRIFTGILNLNPKLVPPPQLAITRGEDRHFRWGLLNTEISFRLPSLRLLLSIFSIRSWIKLGQRSFPNSPYNFIIECTSPQPSHHFYMLANSLFCLCALFRLVVALFVPL